VVKLSRVFTIGEALIDFIPNEKGISLSEVISFDKAPGGAPANVACTVAKLGGESSFIGKLGMDAFGDFLIDTLKNTGVDISNIKRSTEANTALAFVSLKADGNREFMFYRDPSADMLLSPEEIEGDWFNKNDILHFCSVDLIEAPVKYAHIKAINFIKEKGGIVSFDPNVRLPLWNNEEECRKTILSFIPMSNILKISDEELEFITNIKNKEDAIKSLFVGDVEVVIFTKGPNGAEVYTKNINVSVEGINVTVVDTTGAGDAFIGAFLYKISTENIDIKSFTEEKAYSILKFANTVAAICTTRKGAIKSLPKLYEVISRIGE
jgi:fructokinase